MALLTRRSFLLAVGTAALTLPVGIAPAIASTRGVRSISLGRSSFAPLVGSTFRMTGRTWSADVVLDEVGDLVPVRRPGDEQRFSLIFRAGAGVPAAAATYQLRHARAGAVDLFAVPVDRGLSARYYQVIVNRAL